MLSWASSVWKPRTRSGSHRSMLQGLEVQSFAGPPPHHVLYLLPPVSSGRLRSRETLPRGEHYEPFLDCLFLLSKMNQTNGRRYGNFTTGVSRNGWPFGCGDGEVIFLGIQNEREWKKFCEEVLGREGMAEDHRFAKNSRRVENRDELHAEIESDFSGLSSEEVIEKLEGAGVANARMRTVRQFLDHPQLEARNRWREFCSPVGPLRGLLPPATLDGAEPVMTPVPEVGEHNEKLLAELGYGETRVLGSSGCSSRCSGSLPKEPSKRLPS
jgi:hypothetical protein